MGTIYQTILIGVHILEYAPCAENAKGASFANTVDNEGIAGIAGGAKCVLMANRSPSARHVEEARSVLIKNRSKIAEYVESASTIVSSGTVPNARNVHTTSSREPASSVYTVSME